MKFLVCALMALSLAVTPAVAITEEPDPLVVSEAFLAARDLMNARGALIEWDRPAPALKITLHRRVKPTDLPSGEVGRTFAQYGVLHTFGTQGQLLFQEQIFIFLLPEEDCLLKEVLIHEFLHYFHERLIWSNVRAAQIEPEFFVDHYYTMRDTFPMCPE